MNCCVCGARINVVIADVTRWRLLLRLSCRRRASSVLTAFLLRVFDVIMVDFRPLADN